jgi:anti-sigma factor RsiW
MTHPDDDTILRYALDMAGAQDDTGAPGREGTAAHISACPECSRALRELQAQVALIAQSDPLPEGRHRPVPPLPLLRYNAIRTSWRAAAAVAVILLGGYLAIGPNAGTRVTVVPQRFTPPAAVVRAGEYAPCEAVDIAHL